MKTLSIILLACFCITCSTNNVNKQGTSEVEDTVSKKQEALPTEKDSVFIGEFIFGMFNGESYTAPMFRLNTNTYAASLWADYNKTFFKGAAQLKFETSLNQLTKIKLAQEVVNNIPDTLVHSANNTTFGCPDCADGGAIYIKFTPVGGETKTFTIDLLNKKGVPQEIVEYAGFVRNKIEEIMK